MQSRQYHAPPHLHKPPAPAQEEARLPRRALRGGTLVLSGYGIRVAVERGHLICSDGSCDARRHLRLSRATSGLTRLVLIAPSGVITLDALRWLHGIGAGIVQIGPDGDVLLAHGPAGPDDARLRRAQALAPAREVGLRIAAGLIRAKLHGQAAVLDDLGAPRAAAALRRAASTLDGPTSLDRLRLIEADAAITYWECWKDVPVLFARRDERAIPDHWRIVGPRSSPLTGSPRLAASPAHAILNYLYAVLESESRIACRAVGLDPGMGILHTDQPARDSLALDLMEPVRPAVDAYLLRMLRERVWGRETFQETLRGACRVAAPLARLLAGTGPLWARGVAAWAERTASLLMADVSRDRGKAFRVPTPLTQANRIAARDAVRRTPPHPPRLPAVDLPPSCRSCGVLLEGARRRRLYCPDCGAEQQAQALEAGRRIGREMLRQARVTGRDTSHGGEAARSRGEKIARANRERARWHGPLPDADSFRRDILPRLQGVPLRLIAQAAGISANYASCIRRGLQVPHPRLWPALRSLAPAPAPVPRRG